QADEQPAAAAADGDPRRRADRDRDARPARPVPAAALRADGRGDGGAGAGGPLAALARPVRGPGPGRAGGVSPLRGLRASGQPSWGRFVTCLGTAGYKPALRVLSARSNGLSSVNRLWRRRRGPPTAGRSPCTCPPPSWG